MTLDQYFEEKEMKIKQIQYARRFNLGNNETEEIGFPRVELEPLETVDQGFEQLKRQAMRIHESLATLEPVKNVIPVTQQPGIPWEFDPTEFLEHRHWKRGGKKPDGSYDKGNLDYGWDFLYQDREHTKLTFSKAATDLLKKGPITIGDDYVVSLNDSGTFVTVKKKKK